MADDGPPTLMDVALRAGVSRSTASRVLNDHPSVRPEVRRRVQEAMAAMGYVRDEVARSLRSGTSRVIALVIPRPPATVFGDAYFAALVAEVVAAGATRGRTVAIVLAGEPGDRGQEVPARITALPVTTPATRTTTGRERDPGTSDDGGSGSGRGGAFGGLARRLTAGGLFDGVILAASVDLDDLPSGLMERGLPLVVVGDPDRPEVCSVDVDNEAGSRLAAQHLLANGRRSIAVLGGPATNASARSRLTAARVALVEAGRPPVWQAAAQDFSVRAGRELAHRLVAAAPGRFPDGIVAGSDAIAAGVLDELAVTGLRVPEDVAVVGFDDLSPARATTPPLTTIRQPIDEVARRAVDHLVELVEGDAIPGCRQVSDVALVVRASTGG